jgi:hypothetical protein
MSHSRTWRLHLYTLTHFHWLWIKRLPILIHTIITSSIRDSVMAAKFLNHCYQPLDSPALAWEDGKLIVSLYQIFKPEKTLCPWPFSHFLRRKGDCLMIGNTPSWWSLSPMLQFYQNTFILPNKVNVELKFFFLKYFGCWYLISNYYIWRWPAIQRSPYARQLSKTTSIDQCLFQNNYWRFKRIFSLYVYYNWMAVDVSSTYDRWSVIVVKGTIESEQLGESSTLLHSAKELWVS